MDSCLRIVSLGPRSRAAAAAPFVLSRLVTLVRLWRTYSPADSLSWASCCATTYALAGGLPGPKKNNGKFLLLLVDTAIEGSAPSRAVS